MKGLICFVTLISVALAAPKPEVPEGRVVGGENAPDGQFPYQVSVQGCILGIICSHICGGTIIGPTTVVTAGHCILSSYTYRILAGVTRLSETTAARQVISASSTLVHPGYPGGSSVSPHDLAIIRLSQSIIYSSTVQPAQLPSPNAEPFGTAILSGWGTTGTTTSPDHLQWLNLLIIEQQQCHDELREVLGATTNVPLEPNGGNVCTSGRGAVSACSGDSGGPLVQNNHLIGVVSWGVTPCGQAHAPSVFVKVSHYSTWISANSYDFNGLEAEQQHLALGVY